MTWISLQNYQNIDDDDDDDSDAVEELEDYPVSNTAQGKFLCQSENVNAELNVTGAEAMELECQELHQKKVNIWKKNKQLKEKGLSYTRPDATIVPARKVKPACECRMKCYEKYNDCIRKELLANLLRLKLSGQNQFLSSHVTIVKTARPQIVNSRRQYSRIYRLPGVDGSVKVCKIMYMVTFDISDRKLRTLAAKSIQGLGIAEDDRRDSNNCRQMISLEHKKYIERHIRSFPAYSSHYTREKSSRLYLSSDLNVLRMYELYQNRCASENAWIPVHYNTYRIIFNSMNLAFRKPKMDTCGECDKFRTKLKLCKSDVEKEDLKRQYELHQTSAKVVYDEKRKDKSLAMENPTVRTASFDLQKQLPTPYLTCGQAFYARQLYTYNLTVFDTYLGSHSASCFLWDETKARRGSQEIASCLLMDLQSMPSTVEHMIYYSDRCAGQNHNKTIVGLFAYFIELEASNGRKLAIHHKFMKTGHSHMEVDTVHAAIEKAKRRTTVDIEIPHDWAVFISAIRGSVPFKVFELEQRCFLAFKHLTDRYSIPKRSEAGDLVRFKDIMVFIYSTEAPGEVAYKYDPTQEGFEVMRITHETAVSIETVDLMPLHTAPLPLSDAKLSDLRGLLPYIRQKEFYQTFLKGLIPAKRGRKAKTTRKDDFENDLDFDDNVKM